MDAVTVDALAAGVASRVPVLLWGDPGTGKSSAVRALADHLGLVHEVVIASIREPSDFAGLPIVSGGSVRFAPPAWAVRLAEHESGLLFLDELSTAPPAVQAALLRVVLERTVGDLVLPAGIAIVAAANPPDQAAHGWDLTAPLANRFCHLPWTVDARVVSSGLVAGFETVARRSAAAPSRAAVAAARTLVSGFLVARPTLTCAPPDDPATAGQAWPSPRTWEMTATLWAAATGSADPRRTRSLLVRGAVGNGAGAEFLTWAEELDLPDPEQVLADPASLVVPDRADRAHAVLTGVAAVVAANPTLERWQAGWRVLDVAAASAPDVAVAAARILARCRPRGAPVPTELRRLLPVLAAAGVVEGLDGG